jgi:hypothetical protein
VSNLRYLLVEADDLVDLGFLARAARILRRVRRKADRVGDAKALEDIDRTIDQIRQKITGSDLKAFDAFFSGDKPSKSADDSEPAELSPISAALAGFGALLMVISVFLPRVEAKTFGRVAQNTLIESGYGWIFVALAVFAVGATWHAYQHQRRSFAPVVLGAIGIGYAIYEGVSKSSLRLCPVDSSILNSACEQATPSIGIYAAGIGSLLVAIGGYQIWRAKWSEAAERDSGTSSSAGQETKICPDCAEMILAEARVCRYCGYRFKTASSSDHA